MHTRIKIAIVILLLLAWAAAIEGAFFLLNMPSDFAFYTGVIGLLASFILMPSLLMKVIRIKKRTLKESHEENPTA